MGGVQEPLFEKLYWTDWEARNFNIAHAGRSQHGSCAKSSKKYVGKANCNSLKRKALAPSANSEKPPTFFRHARTRSWDDHEKNSCRIPDAPEIREATRRASHRRAGMRHAVCQCLVESVTVAQPNDWLYQAYSESRGSEEAAIRFLNRVAQRRIDGSKADRWLKGG
jgi:hypothetical protein